VLNADKDQLKKMPEFKYWDRLRSYFYR